MLQDYEKGKELELDSLVVSIKEIGDLLGIKTPTIDKILYEVEKKKYQKIISIWNQNFFIL